MSRENLLAFYRGVYKASYSSIYYSIYYSILYYNILYNYFSKDIVVIRHPAVVGLGDKPVSHGFLHRFHVELMVSVILGDKGLNFFQ